MMCVEHVYKERHVLKDELIIHLMHVSLLRQRFHLADVSAPVREQKTSRSFDALLKTGPKQGLFLRVRGQWSLIVHVLRPVQMALGCE